MLIYKFGGISVESAEAIKNIAKIISNINENLVVVVSAMGKMTNKFEDLINSYFTKKVDLQDKLEIIKQFHLEIIDTLFDKNHRIFGYKNMMICDGSTLSANPGVNPSLTITAMAERAMESIPNKKL